MRNGHLIRFTQSMYLAICYLFAKCTKHGKVCNFEGHFALSGENAQNGLKVWPHLEMFIRSLNMQSVVRCA